MPQANDDDLKMEDMCPAIQGLYAAFRKGDDYEETTKALVAVALINKGEQVEFTKPQLCLAPSFTSDYEKLTLYEGATLLFQLQTIASELSEKLREKFGDSEFSETIKEVASEIHYYDIN